MADNRYDEAVDIIARQVTSRWFMNHGVLPAAADRAVRDRVRDLLPEPPNYEEFQAAHEYLTTNREKGTNHE